MKAQIPARPTEGLTLIELLVIIVVVGFLGVQLLVVLHAAKYHLSGRINCIKNLHEIGTAFQIWKKDHNDKYPMPFAFTNNETLKIMTNGSAYILWQTMSNELNTPKVLYCPDDKERKAALSFSSGFTDVNISYFLNLDVSNETNANMILDGDDNLANNGMRVKPGILNLPTTNSLAWTRERHRGAGDIGMADGSVLQTTPATLNAAIINATNGAPVTTYRWVIP